MFLQEYQEAVMRTCGPADYQERLAMAAIGIAGETGEIADLVKKYLWHQHDLDTEKMKLEIGDLAWYIALLCNVLNLSLYEVLEANITKLRKRYPDGFSSERSKHRTE